MTMRPVAVRLPPHRSNGLVRLPVTLDYLKGQPVEYVTLTPLEAINLARELLGSAAGLLKEAPR